MAPEKRRASSRLRELPATRLRISLSEKRHSSPAQKPKEKKEPPKPATPPESPKKVDPLPTKPIDTAPLPTLRGIDVESLADIELQSIADSGVLAASLQRSRQRWVQEFMFEKYWSKATYKKKKESADNDKPHGKDARPPMTKIGTCKLIAEPHIFDVTIFVVRDTSTPQPVGDRQFVQYGPASSPLTTNTVTAPSTQNSTDLSSGASIKPNIAPSAPSETPKSSIFIPPAKPPLIAATPTPQSTGAHLTSNPLPKPSPTPTSSPAATQTQNPIPALTTINTPQSSIASPASAQTRPSVAPTTPAALRTSAAADQAPASRIQPPVVQSRQPPTPSTAQQSRKPASSPQVATDPVIQMLAQRATTDNALKQVMKIVASGKANPKQLDYFQGHIDELTRIVNERQAEEKRKNAIAMQQKLQQQRQQKLQQKMDPPGTPVTEKNGPLAHRQVAQALPLQKTPVSRVPIPPTGARQVYNLTPVTPKPRPAAPPPSHVLIEFGLNQTDRFLFPRNSIVEYESDDSVRASFFVVKKPSELPSANPLLGKKYVRAKKVAEMKRDESKASEENASNDRKDSEVATSDIAAKKESKPTQKDVFQPVTIRFESPSDPSVLTVFGRVVAPISEVVKYMTDVSNRCERAETAPLALRLPRTTESTANAQVSVAA